MHEAFSRIDMVMYQSTTLNTGHAWGRGRETLILPVLARDEESQSTTQESMFNYVRLSDGGEARHDREPEEGRERDQHCDRRVEDLAGVELGYRHRVQAFIANLWYHAAPGPLYCHRSGRPLEPRRRLDCPRLRGARGDHARSSEHLA